MYSVHIVSFRYTVSLSFVFVTPFFTVCVVHSMRSIRFCRKFNYKRLIANKTSPISFLIYAVYTVHNSCFPVRSVGENVLIKVTTLPTTLVITDQ